MFVTQPGRGALPPLTPKPHVALIERIKRFKVLVNIKFQISYSRIYIFYKVRIEFLNLFIFNLKSYLLKNGLKILGYLSSLHYVKVKVLQGHEVPEHSNYLQSVNLVSGIRVFFYCDLRVNFNLNLCFYDWA